MMCPARLPAVHAHSSDCGSATPGTVGNPQSRSPAVPISKGTVGRGSAGCATRPESSGGHLPTTPLPALIRRQPEPSPPQRLRELARKVRRLSLSGRLDVEASFVERDELARALVRIAAELERAA